MRIRASVNEEIEESIHYINNIERGKALPNKSTAVIRFITIGLCIIIGMSTIYVIYPLINAIFRNFQQIIVEVF